MSFFQYMFPSQEIGLLKIFVLLSIMGRYNEREGRKNYVSTRVKSTQGSVCFGVRPERA